MNEAIITTRTPTPTPTPRTDVEEELTAARATSRRTGVSAPRLLRFGLVGLFTLTAFVGASLLFVVQPLIARIVLPSYGGSATVWSTSSLFFQLLLLLGYLYSHVATRRLGARWQPPVHLLVLLAPLVVLPVALPLDAVPDAEASPVLWLLRTLVLMIGLPFVVISTSGPLIQRWYSWSGGPRADDPYFLFAASNVGSFVGLLAYPFLIEPFLTVDQQRVAWSGAFVFFALLTALCGVVTRIRALSGSRIQSPEGELGAARMPIANAAVQGISRHRRATWVAASFLPSAMMLAVTSHISTDVAAIPLLWVMPLAIYLATFVLAFGRTSRVTPMAVNRAAIIATIAAAAIYPVSAYTPVWVVVPLLLTMLAVVAYAAHAKLAADRPGVEHLTGYYLIVSIGGALGGVLNGLIAPILFDRVWEYALLLIVVPLLLSRDADSGSRLVAYASRHWVALVITVLGSVVLLRIPTFSLMAGRATGGLLTALVVVIVGAWAISGSGRRIAVLALTVFMVTCFIDAGRGALEHRRTFYGSYRVLATEGKHVFMHGTTIHGLQWQNDLRSEPTSYFSRSGPLGDVFAQPNLVDVATVGLGAGTVAAHGKEGQRFSFIEIDPAVVDIAKDSRFFTYLADSKADIDVEVGDGRLALENMPDASKDLILLDAFSSDSIPVHLLTVEAMRTYASKLRPGGLLVVHISNRVFDLRPVVRGAANDLGWQAAFGSKGETNEGSSRSQWVALSSNAARISTLQGKQGWGALTEESLTWTDDYSSVLSVLR
ncbi:spermidine synthase [Knoellia sp. CPCC 206435]|uniref:spermidine synthase n=1 Tax=Knoellia terrae TaxID=3404797 RepID=UPI003B43A6CB